MPKVEDYTDVNPSAFPQPRVYTGYTGHVPGTEYQHGAPYGRLNHLMMLDNPVAGERLAPILDDSRQLMEQAEDDYYVDLHNSRTKHLIYKKPMVVGYTGFVPQRKFLCGKPYDKECHEATASFQKFQNWSRRKDEPVDQGPKPEPEKAASVPLNISTFDPRIRYNISEFMTEGNRRRYVYDPEGGARDWDELCMLSNEQHVNGDPFGCHDWFYHRMKAAMNAKRRSIYDDYNEQPIRHNMPVPWYSKQTYYPEFALRKSWVGGKEERLKEEKHFLSLLRK